MITPPSPLHLWSKGGPNGSGWKTTDQYSLLRLVWDKTEQSGLLSFPPICGLARSSWLPPPWSSMLEHPSKPAFDSGGHVFFTDLWASRTASFTCHLDFEDLFSVSSAFGHPSWLLDCSTLLQLLRSPYLPVPVFLSHPCTHTDALVLALRASMTIGFGLLTHSHSPTQHHSVSCFH